MTQKKTEDSDWGIKGWVKVNVAAPIAKLQKPPKATGGSKATAKAKPLDLAAKLKEQISTYRTKELYLRKLQRNANKFPEEWNKLSSYIREAMAVTAYTDLQLNALDSGTTDFLDVFEVTMTNPKKPCLAQKRPQCC